MWFAAAIIGIIAIATGITVLPGGTPKLAPPASAPAAAAPMPPPAGTGTQP
jgi:hypothetical protein